jgi:hypothetical protein
VIEVTRVDYVRVPVDNVEKASEMTPRDSGICHGVGTSDPAGNRILLDNRYKPYEQS